MVQWKGDLDYSQAGAKAKHLDRLENFNVPNFFVITRREVQQTLPENKEPQRVLNTELNQELLNEVEDAHSNVGVTSEIRNASGKARSLVGNRREASRVSVRVSTSKTGSYYQLNVGSSNIENAIKQVLANYFEDHDETPAVIIQKMVEPGHTGAIVTDYRSGYSLVESVKGLGNPLEEASTSPETYLVRNGEIKDKKLPEKQIEVTRHPVNGKNRKRTVKREQSPYRRRKLLDKVSKLASTGFNVKYVYKRGTFYIVDASPARNQAASEKEQSLDFVKAAGDWSNVSDFKLVEQPPEVTEYERPVVARKGGYTSTRSQQARDHDKKLAVSPRDEFLSKHQDQEEHGEKRQQESANPFSQDRERQRKQKLPETASIELMQLNQGKNSLRTKPPYEGRYNIVPRVKNENDIHEENVLTSYSEVFALDRDIAVLDSRLVPREGLENALDYIEAEQKILIAARADREMVKALIESEFDILVVENQALSEVAEMVELEERRIILDKIREI